VATFFADTSFWMALSRKRDQYNPHAVAWNQFVIRTRSVIVTTEADLWEWLNALSDASTRSIAAEGYGRAHADARIEVVPFHADLDEAALLLYEGRHHENWSLTDCLSFLTMEQRGIARALTSDHHFQQAGFEALLLGNPPAAA